MLIALAHAHVYFSPTSMLLMASSPVPRPLLTTNLRKQFPGLPQMPLSKLCKGSLMQQQRRQLPLRFLHLGMRDLTVHCGPIITLP
jgi:hypothetical protein